MYSKTIHLLTLVLCAIFLSACSTTSVELRPDAELTPTKSTYTVFVGAIVPVLNPELDAAEVCGGEELVAKLETKQDIVSTFVNYGAFSIRQNSVYCLR